MKEFETIWREVEIAIWQLQREQYNWQQGTTGCVSVTPDGVVTTSWGNEPCPDDAIYITAGGVTVAEYDDSVSYNEEKDLWIADDGSEYTREQQIEAEVEGDWAEEFYDNEADDVKEALQQTLTQG